MDESGAVAVNARSEASYEEMDEAAIRRAIHDLGSDDYEARATARTFILSAGEIAVKILMRELDADRKRSREIAQRVALLVAFIVIVGPAVGMYTGRGWLIAGANIAACVVLLVACLLYTRPTWHSEAAKLLGRYHSPEVTHAMIDSLVDVWGEEQPRLRAAIIHRLASIKRSDAEWLKGETLERVIALASVPDWSSPVCVEHTLILAKALLTVGATDAIPSLKGINCGSLQGERRERLESGLAEVIRKLEELAARKQPREDLLRPAHQDEVALVRASAAPSDPELLLQASDDQPHAD